MPGDKEVADFKREVDELIQVTSRITQGSIAVSDFFSDTVRQCEKYKKLISLISQLDHLTSLANPTEIIPSIAEMLPSYDVEKLSVPKERADLKKQIEKTLAEFEALRPVEMVKKYAFYNGQLETLKAFKDIMLSKVNNQGIKDARKELEGIRKNVYTASKEVAADYWRYVRNSAVLDSIDPMAQTVISPRSRFERAMLGEYILGADVSVTERLSRMIEWGEMLEREAVAFVQKEKALALPAGSKEAEAADRLLASSVIDRDDLSKMDLESLNQINKKLEVEVDQIKKQIDQIRGEYLTPERKKAIEVQIEDLKKKIQKNNEDLAGQEQRLQSLNDQGDEGLSEREKKQLPDRIARIEQSIELKRKEALQYASTLKEMELQLSKSEISEVDSKRLNELLKLLSEKNSQINDMGVLVSVARKIDSDNQRVQAFSQQLITLKDQQEKVKSGEDTNAIFETYEKAMDLFTQSNALSDTGRLLWYKSMIKDTKAHPKIEAMFRIKDQIKNGIASTEKREWYVEAQMNLQFLINIQERYMLLKQQIALLPRGGAESSEVMKKKSALEKEYQAAIEKFISAAPPVGISQRPAREIFVSVPMPSPTSWRPQFLFGIARPENLEARREALYSRVDILIVRAEVAHMKATVLGEDDSFYITANSEIGTQIQMLRGSLGRIKTGDLTMLESIERDLVDSEKRMMGLLEIIEDDLYSRSQLSHVEGDPKVLLERSELLEWLMDTAHALTLEGRAYQVGRWMQEVIVQQESFIDQAEEQYNSEVTKTVEYFDPELLPTVVVAREEIAQLRENLANEIDKIRESKEEGQVRKIAIVMDVHNRKIAHIENMADKEKERYRRQPVVDKEREISLVIDGVIRLESEIATCKEQIAEAAQKRPLLSKMASQRKIQEKAEGELKSLKARLMLMEKQMLRYQGLGTLKTLKMQIADAQVKLDDFEGERDRLSSTLEQYKQSRQVIPLVSQMHATALVIARDAFHGSAAMPERLQSFWHEVRSKVDKEKERLYDYLVGEGEKITLQEKLVRFSEWHSAIKFSLEQRIKFEKAYLIEHLNLTDKKITDTLGELINAEEAVEQANKSGDHDKIVAAMKYRDMIFDENRGLQRLYKLDRQYHNFIEKSPQFEQMKENQIKVAAGLLVRYFHGVDHAQSQEIVERFMLIDHPAFISGLEIMSASEDSNLQKAYDQLRNATRMWVAEIRTTTGSMDRAVESQFKKSKEKFYNLAQAKREEKADQLIEKLDDELKNMKIEMRMQQAEYLKKLEEIKRIAKDHGAQDLVELVDSYGRRGSKDSKRDSQTSMGSLKAKIDELDDDNAKEALKMAFGAHQKFKMMQKKCEVIEKKQFEIDDAKDHLKKAHQEYLKAEKNQKIEKEKIWIRDLRICDKEIASGYELLSTKPAEQVVIPPGSRDISPAESRSTSPERREGEARRPSQPRKPSSRTS